jgi:dipeptidyl aminopeptidase/acylaminoacyl peptidase
MSQVIRSSVVGFGLAALALYLLAYPRGALAELPPMIPREVLFGNPERLNPQISPDGQRLAWLAPDKKNVLQVWVKTIGQNDEHMVTADKKRGIRQFQWGMNKKVMLYLQDSDGDENWHVYGVDLASNKVRDFTPGDKLQAQITATDPNYPDEVLISLNKRSPSLHDVYRLNLNTGDLALDTENPGDVLHFFADPQLQIRAAQVTTRDGGTEIRIRDAASSSSPWKTWLKVGPDEELSFADFTRDGNSATIISSIDSDTARVVVRSIESGEERVIAGSREVDAGIPMIHPTKHHVEAVSFTPGRSHWTVVDPSVKKDFDGIRNLSDGDFTVMDRDTSDKTWLVAFTSDQGPIRYYAWDRAAKKGTFLFVHQPKLDGLKLAPMTPVVIDTRDGLKLHGYLTLPVGVPARNLPMVLLVHGGPWGRDSWGFNPMAQWFANRGYACLQVNFRGSTGYGKKHLHAGDRQWGLTMHNDLIDASNWAVKQGYVNPKKIAIFGGSYGGYAALAGVTFTPDFFACAVDVVGPSNLKTLIRSIPPYWKPMKAMLTARVGDVDDPRDADLIKNASPLFKADKIVRPLLIGQGANDPRVKQAESDQIVAAIEKSGGKATYILYPDEGHGFRRPENSIDFNARAEAFLGKYLGGRVEPMNGEKYPGSTAIVKKIGQ